MSIYRNGSYLSKSKSWHKEDAPFKTRYILKMMQKNKIYPKTVCEVGCGTGEILKLLAKDLSDIERLVGYDISPQAIELASQNKIDRVSFICGEIFDDPQHYDLILVIDVVEHIEDCYGFLRKLKNKAKLFIFHFPIDITPYSIIFREKLLVNGFDFPGHIHKFTRKTAMKVLEYLGYEILDEFLTPSAMESPSKSSGQRLFNVFRRMVGTFSPDLSNKLFCGWASLILAK